MTSLPPQIPTSNYANNPTLGLKRSFVRKKYWNDLILLRAIWDRTKATTDNTESIISLLQDVNTTLTAIRDFVASIDNNFDTLLSRQLLQLGNPGVTTTVIEHLATVEDKLQDIDDKLHAENSTPTDLTVGQSLAIISDCVRPSDIATDSLYLATTDIKSDTNSIASSSSTTASNTGPCADLFTIPLPVV